MSQAQIWDMLTYEWISTTDLADRILRYNDRYRKNVVRAHVYKDLNQLHKYGWVEKRMVGIHAEWRKSMEAPA